MPYDLGLATRLSEMLTDEPGMQEKKMFGGIGWLLNGNMCVGIYKDFLVVRAGPSQAELALKTPHTKPMDITGKPMKGWVMVAPPGYASDQDLRQYVEKAVSFVQELPAK